MNKSPNFELQHHRYMGELAVFYTQAQEYDTVLIAETLHGVLVICPFYSDEEDWRKGYAR